MNATTITKSDFKRIVREEYANVLQENKAVEQLSGLVVRHLKKNKALAIKANKLLQKLEPKEKLKIDAKSAGRAALKFAKTVYLYIKQKISEDEFVAGAKTFMNVVAAASYVVLIFKLGFAGGNIAFLIAVVLLYWLKLIKNAIVNDYKHNLKKQKQK